MKTTIFFYNLDALSKNATMTMCDNFGDNWQVVVKTDRMEFFLNKPGLAANSFSITINPAKILTLELPQLRVGFSAAMNSPAFALLVAAHDLISDSIYRSWIFSTLGQVCDLMDEATKI